MTEDWPLRPYLAGDVMILRELFAASVEELMQDDYDENQRAAWVSIAEDEVEFQVRLGEQLTLVVEVEGEQMGFVSLKDNSVLDMLYVHPHYVGQGIGTALVEAVEKIAKARGAKSIAVDSSDTAQMFFEERGYSATQRTTLPLEDELLSMTAMVKTLKT
ncbi:MAG: GNAT family N-acetyltransferase [Hyphomicrobium sp.]